jgi:hypothetical protein
MSPGRLGLLVGIAVVVVAIAISVITNLPIAVLIMSWALTVALVGWLVFALYERWRRRTD